MKDGVKMQADIFEKLWNSMHQTDTSAVLDFQINGKTYWGYSQSIPASVDGGPVPYDQVRFAIFFLKPKSSS